MTIIMLVLFFRGGWIEKLNQDAIFQVMTGSFYKNAGIELNFFVIHCLWSFKIQHHLWSSFYVYVQDHLGYPEEPCIRSCVSYKTRPSFLLELGAAHKFLKRTCKLCFSVSFSNLNWCGQQKKTTTKKTT